MTNRDTDNRDPVNRDPDNRDDNDNRKETALAASSLTGGALASLAALGTTLNSVDTASVIGRSERAAAHVQEQGQRRHLDVRAEAHHRRRRQPLGRQPATFQRGYVCFDGNKKVGEKLLPVSQPMPDLAELPDKGFPWQEQWAVNMKCLDGADAGNEVIFKAVDRRRHPGHRGADRRRSAIASTAASTTARSCRSCCSKSTTTRIRSTGRP